MMIAIAFSPWRHWRSSSVADRRGRLLLVQVAMSARRMAALNNACADVAQAEVIALANAFGVAMIFQAATIVKASSAVRA